MKKYASTGCDKITSYLHFVFQSHAKYRYVVGLELEFILQDYLIWKYNFTSMLTILPSIFSKVQNSIFKDIAKQWSMVILTFRNFVLYALTKIHTRRISRGWGISLFFLIRKYHTYVILSSCHFCGVWQKKLQNKVTILLSKIFKIWDSCLRECLWQNG